MMLFRTMHVYDSLFDVGDVGDVGDVVYIDTCMGHLDEEMILGP